MNRLQMQTAVWMIAALVPATSLAADSASSCGRISVFDTAPRSQELYPAVLIAVDGKLPGPTSSTSFRLSPGIHVLTVAEAIDPVQFGSLQQYQRDRPARDRYHTLELQVEPGITYRLAAKLDTAKRQQIRNNAYWGPVIWKQKDEPCG